MYDPATLSAPFENANARRRRGAVLSARAKQRLTEEPRCPRKRPTRKSGNDITTEESGSGGHVAAFYKTRFCRYFVQQGTCWKGEACQFAHSQEELRPPPDLTKTRMCSLYRVGFCNETAENCPFAHSLSELKATDTFFKTEICSFWAAGYCRAGVQCRHAHGDHELRQKPLSRQSTKSSPRSSPTEETRSPMSAEDSLASALSPGQRPVSCEVGGERSLLRCSSTFVPSANVEVKTEALSDDPEDGAGPFPSSARCDIRRHRLLTDDDFPSAQEQGSPRQVIDPTTGRSFLSFVGSAEIIYSAPTARRPLMVVCHGVACEVPHSVLRAAGWATGVQSNHPALVGVGVPVCGDECYTNQGATFIYKSGGYDQPWLTSRSA